MADIVAIAGADAGTGPEVPASGARPRWQAAAGGLAAAGAALATGELLSGLDERTPSLVLGVAEVFVAETPGGIVRWSIDAFGASQKTVLVTGIVVVSLLLGVVFGLLGRRRWVRGAAGFVAFGLVGGWAAARGALSSDVRSWLAAALATAVGVLVLRFGLRTPGLAGAGAGAGASASAAAATAATGEGPDLLAPGRPGPGRDRRRFLAVTGGAAAYGILAAGVGRWLRNSRTVEGARDEVATQLGPAPPVRMPSAVASFDETVPGISPLITPNADFYRIDTALLAPQVDPADWTLRITGMVDHEVELTFDELLAMDRIDEFVTLQCVSNEVGGDLVGNARWSGVPLAGLLDRAGVRPDASQIVGRSVDGWTAGFPTEVAGDGRPAMVAVAMNGEPLPVKHGFPARLIVPGLYGYVSATKWLTEIELTTWEAFDAYWIPRGWAKEGPIKTQSRIDVPRSGSTVSAGSSGRIAVAGVAWAPTRSIARVEVRVDDQPWAQARLSGKLSDDAWVQWLYEWDARPGRHQLQVRATDGDGRTQTSETAPPAPSGATGHHTITVTVR
jgi:DMSO/TMAO reductase YedYZ molybdopterin-dependent catalytic subunit